MAVTITSDAEGFVLETEPPIAVQQRDITKIVAFKRDLLTSDLICLEFHLNNGTTIETDEEMDGYSRFFDHVTSQFDLTPNWWSDVAFPAFKTNMATVWSADTQCRGSQIGLGTQISSGSLPYVLACGAALGGRA